MEAATEPRLMTCSLCLMGDPIFFLQNVRTHGDPTDHSTWIVCADSDLFPFDLPVAIKVASA